MNRVGPQIKKRREELGLEVADLAKMVGMGVTTLYELERGVTRSTPKLHRIAAVLRTTASWLETGKGNPEASGMATEPTTLHNIPISEAGAQVGAEWDKLREPLRSQIQLLIETLVAGQKRGERKKSAAARVEPLANNHDA